MEALFRNFQGHAKKSKEVSYEEAVRRKYYRANKDAKVDLKKTDIDRMDKANEQDKANSAASKRAEELNKFAKEREAVDQELFRRKNRVSLDKLRKIAKEISTNKSPEFAAKIDRITDRKRLQKGIKEILDSDGAKPDFTRNDKVAVMLK